MIIIESQRTTGKQLFWRFCTSLAALSSSSSSATISMNKGDSEPHSSKLYLIACCRCRQCCFQRTVKTKSWSFYPVVSYAAAQRKWGWAWWFVVGVRGVLVPAAWRRRGNAELLVCMDCLYYCPSSTSERCRREARASRARLTGIRKVWMSRHGLFV